MAKLCRLAENGAGVRVGGAAGAVRVMGAGSKISQLPHRGRLSRTWPCLSGTLPDAASWPLKHPPPQACCHDPTTIPTDLLHRPVRARRVVRSAAVCLLSITQPNHHLISPECAASSRTAATCRRRCVSSSTQSASVYSGLRGATDGARPCRRGCRAQVGVMTHATLCPMSAMVHTAGAASARHVSPGVPHPPRPTAPMCIVPLQPTRVVTRLLVSGC